MDASLVPVSLPTRGSLVARTTARIAPLFLIAAVAVYLLSRESGVGTATARGFSDATQLVIASATGGRLTEVTVAIGQRVKAGDVVAKLDSQTLELELKKLEAEKRLLEAKVIAETSREEDGVLRAEIRRLRTVAASRRDEAALSALDEEVERLNELLQDQLVKASDVEPRRRERAALAARVGAYDQSGMTSKLLKSGKSGAGGGGDQHRAIVQLRVAPIREELRVKEAELAQVAHQVGSMTLRAPTDGVVSVINRRAGELLAAGEPAMIIVNHRPGIFAIYIPERQSRLPRIGDRVHLSRRGVFSRAGQGRVIEVAPDISELPLRLRASPSIPVWGRRILVDATESEGMRNVPPGEELRVRL